MPKTKIAAIALFLACFLILPIIGLAGKSTYLTSQRQQFRVQILKNWKKKVKTAKVTFYPKTAPKNILEIKKTTLSKKGQKYLKAKNAKKFSALYEKKIEKEFKALHVKFQKAEKYKIANYKVIHLWFSYASINLNVYYLTNGNLYHRG